MSRSVKSGRVPLFDELRGLSILLVVIYHGAYDLVAAFGVSIPIFGAPLLQLFLQPLFAGLFVFISGAVSRYSRSNLRRGAACLACGLLLTAATAFIGMVPDWFGILHLLGTCMILFALLHPPLDRLPAAAGLLLFLALFFLCYRVPGGSFGIPPFSVRLPESWYASRWLFPIGFPRSSFASSDYFPLLPWGLLFFAGSYLGVWAKAGRLPAFCYRGHIPFLAAVGRRSLWIYLLHQPLLFVLLGGFVWLARGILGLPI